MAALTRWVNVSRLQLILTQVLLTAGYGIIQSVLDTDSLLPDRVELPREIRSLSGKILSGLHIFRLIHEHIFLLTSRSDILDNSILCAHSGTDKFHLRCQPNFRVSGIQAEGTYPGNVRTSSLCVTHLNCHPCTLSLSSRTERMHFHGQPLYLAITIKSLHKSNFKKTR